MKNIYFLLFSFLVLFSACQKDDEDDFLPEENDQKGLAFGIRHDKNLSEYEAIAAGNGTDLPNFSSVIAFNYSLDGSTNYEFTATGTLIDSLWILTAAHNFYDAEEQNSPAIASGVQVLVGNDPNLPDQIYAVAQIVIHPTWLNGDQDYSDANDLCLVKLSTPIRNLQPIKLHSSSTEAIGSKVWFCGFGDYSGTEGQNPNLDSKKHAMENILDRKNSGLQTTVGSTTYNGGLLAYDFDDPTGNINALGDNTINSDENILGSGTSASGASSFEGATVEGDSGGPLFVKNGSDWEVAGVLSGGAQDPIANHIDGDYGDISIFTRVSTSHNWIQSVIQ